jgi:hypothetical protein
MDDSLKDGRVCIPLECLKACLARRATADLTMSPASKQELAVRGTAVGGRIVGVVRG